MIRFSIFSVKLTPVLSRLNESLPDILSATSLLKLKLAVLDFLNFNLDSLP